MSFRTRALFALACLVATSAPAVAHDTNKMIVVPPTPIHARHTSEFTCRDGVELSVTISETLGQPISITQASWKGQHADQKVLDEANKYLSKENFVSAVTGRCDDPVYSVSVDAIHPSSATAKEGPGSVSIIFTGEDSPKVDWFSMKDR